MVSMRFFYLILKITLPYSLRVFYPRLKVVNSPKELLGRTIYVSNHANSFMDPLIVAALRFPIVFFMTRSDIFNKYTQPILWGCQMFPIYREQDGDDTRKKNEEVFQKCTRVLKNGRNLLVFGEGFTDDVFIRRLKPIKKGSVKIGFQTLESLNWSKKIYIAAVGCNYSMPGEMRSDLLVATSDKICLNDYREAYEENPNRIITQLTRQIEQMMQDQITHVENKEWAPFHEHIMMLTRKGMNVHNFDRSRPLIERWKYSKSLAKWLNAQDEEALEKLKPLKEEADGYFKLLKRFRLEEHFLYWKDHNGSRMKEMLFMLFMWPFALIGALHCAVPYLITKKFVEKSFRRRVFWGSVKLIMGKILIAVFNIPTIFLFYYLVYPSWWLSVAYFFTIGLTGLSAYMWMRNLRNYKIKGLVRKMDTSKLSKKRSEIFEKIKAAIPAEFH
jgi:hypothetical protein